MLAPMMEFDKTDVEVEPELYYEVEEEMVSIKSTDGHTYRVERDVSKTRVNILFNDEIEDPINHKTDRPVSKAVKRAQQRLLMKEELIEFKMPQCTQYTVPKSTETVIMKVMRRDCQKSSTRSTSSIPTPEAPAKPKDHSDNHNCGEDEDHSAKAAPAATDSMKVTDEPSGRDSNKDSVDNDDEKTNLDLLQLQLHQRVRQSP